MSTHSAIAVADYILNKATEDNNTLTPMQVIKLVYLCHGWTLGLLSRPLIRERVEAWRYGPVINDLYHAVKEFRSSPVQGPLTEEQEEFNEDESLIMDQVYEIYGDYTGMALSRLTHAPGTPWRKTWESGRTTISNDLIEDHFHKMATEE